ncbi:hypothetical protein GCM10010298_66360 [Streptomyces microflavus]|uniref:Uncharacterized protein n=1 Tax=Streptomyces microflavus TaxID=1919 RepID=A0A7J0D5W4_STRMI|nr:hypothetical protein Smic_86890 [Streptomyces microflavus]GGX91816.1 hypothetical protein GCM10010298_66360 [Streptomyces microflavus]
MVREPAPHVVAVVAGQRADQGAVDRGVPGHVGADPRVGVRGEGVTSFEPGLPHLTNGVPAEEALGFVHHGTGAGDVAFLRFLEDELGICLSFEETEAELSSAAFPHAADG